MSGQPGSTSPPGATLSGSSEVGDRAINPSAGTLGSTALAAAALSCLGMLHLLGQAYLLPSVLLAQVGLIMAWTLLDPVPGRQGVRVISLAIAGIVDLLVVVGDAAASYDALILVLIGALLANVGYQMTRPMPRERLTQSLGMGVALAVLVASAAILLVARGEWQAGEGAVTTYLLAVGTALVVANAMDAFVGRPALVQGIARGVPGVVSGLLAGVGITFLAGWAGWLGSNFGAVQAGVSGLAASALALCCMIGATYPAVSSRRGSLAEPALMATLPWCATAAIVPLVTILVNPV